MLSIPFCNANAFKIDNDVLSQKIFARYEEITGVKIKNGHFPGPQPVTVEKKDFETLKTKKYMVCEKSDGERYVMILLKIDSKPMGFIINRNNEIYFVPAAFKKEVFEGSIFDGEIIKTKKGIWHYLIHDCVSYIGKSFVKETHYLRYACILDFILKRYSPKDSDCFLIKTKLFYNYGPEVDKTWEYIKETTENEIDGLIFTPVDEPYTFDRQFSLLKWKTDHTMDLLVKKIGKKINLYGVRKNTNYIFKTISEDHWSYLLITDFCTPAQLKSGVIIEFNYVLNGEIFKPYRMRSDKTIPNGELTINNTVKNIQESILITDFFSI